MGWNLFAQNTVIMSERQNKTAICEDLDLHDVFLLVAPAAENRVTYLLTLVSV